MTHSISTQHHLTARRAARGGVLMSHNDTLPLAAYNVYTPCIYDLQREADERRDDAIAYCADQIESNRDDLLDVIESVIEDTECRTIAEIVLAVRKAWPAIERLSNGDVLRHEHEAALPALKQSFKDTEAAINAAIDEAAALMLEDAA